MLECPTLLLEYLILVECCNHASLLGDEDTVDFSDVRSEPTERPLQMFNSLTASIFRRRLRPSKTLSVLRYQPL
jgi:hypothetical protein